MLMKTWGAGSKKAKTISYSLPQNNNTTTAAISTTGQNKEPAQGNYALFTLCVSYHRIRAVREKGNTFYPLSFQMMLHS